MKKFAYAGLIIFTIVAGITLGIIIHVYNDEKMQKASEEQIKEAQKHLHNNALIQTASQEKKSSPNAYVTFETYYTKCGHSEVKKTRILPEDTNKTEEVLKEKYKDYTLKVFTDDEIVFYKESNKMCQNHFVIKDNNDRIVVYQINEEGEETIKNETNIDTKYLPKEDLELLRKGIRANSQNELQQILSDYE